MNAPIDIKAPASKSVSHRAFICAALAEGTSLVTDALESDDLIRTRRCLTAAGAVFRNTERGWEITGTAGRPSGGMKHPADCDVGESGTTCRLLTAVLAAGRGLFRIHGEGRMHERPIGQLVSALEHLGPVFEWEGKPGFPPFVIRTEGLCGDHADVSLEESSQYLSGLLLAAPMALRPIVVGVGGAKVVSWPYVSLTLMAMADFGAALDVELLQDGAWVPTPFTEVREVVPGGIRFRARPTPYRARSYTVEGDWSNASYFLAAGAAGPRPVRVTGLRRDSLQGDRAILDILQAMGANVEWDDAGVTVSGQGLRGVEVDMGHCPDLVPTVCAVAAQAQGPTTIRNVAHLRIKESDRLEACAAEIARAGGVTATFADGLTVTPAPLEKERPVTFSTYGDHRMAMSLSLLELAGVDVRLDKPACVAKSFPGFWDQWRLVR
ncbi:3-phosphoshikimate 1-carboxyvinyltransferase [Fundidesulfovibrio magnetotacticus]|uniref:3-phosphoshikimate 1-carboxyvinyltransferase n=1 Tax=Fundidesulfovibrio magnetotacticus TaxID=2730080 RepID=A0A6V8LMU2_9BACT|nr:3-phosphoshikimate 1-carboxyvinyltransferase [Fundidesulfovibrio magnetotacticus]GFK93973.1 3-phosphoshikimate 1-carboxyvinyltransferase [Fundidesulfovibrio magnetotacticus]